MSEDKFIFTADTRLDNLLDFTGLFELILNRFIILDTEFRKMLSLSQLIKDQGYVL